MRNNYFKPQMKDMEPIYSPGLDCFENSVLTITNWEYGEYHKAFMHSWGFAYNKDISPMIGKRLMANNHDICEDIRYRYGIVMNQYKENDVEKVIDKIHHELLHNRAVIVSAEEYYCHWTYNYKKSHHNHFYLIHGQTENKDFICLDTQPQKKDIIVTKRQFKENFKHIYTYEIHPAHLEHRFLYEIIRDCIMNNSVNKYRLQVEDMDQFINDFIYIDYDSELMYDAIWYSPIFSEISRIYGGRVQFTEFLKDYQLNEDVYEYIKQLEKITYEWSIIRSLILKMQHNKDDSVSIHHTLIRRIRLATQLEKKLFSIILEHLQTNRLQQGGCYIPPESLDTEVEEFYYVDLNPYFNRKGLYFDKESFKFENDLSTGVIWNIDNMSFDFSHRGHLDNMVCLNQTIPINKKAYSRFMLLGYGEWGNQIEELKIVYEDGSYATVEFMFSDWWKNPELDETIAWQSDGQSLIDGESYNGKIFAKSYQLPDSEKNIVEVVFPDCERIHILAMTFA